MSECSQPVRRAARSANSAVNRFDIEIIGEVTKMDADELTKFEDGVTDFLVATAMDCEAPTCDALFEAASKVQNLYNFSQVRQGIDHWEENVTPFKFEHVDVVARGVLRALEQVYKGSDQELLGAEASLVLRHGRNLAGLRRSHVPVEELDQVGLPNPDLEEWASYRKAELERDKDVIRQAHATTSVDIKPVTV